jgi:ATP-dependent helicase HrpB
LILFLPMQTELPIELILPDLAAALRSGRSAVVQAPPGAGKTTRIPLALLDEEWLADRKIVMLEPRRLAARAAARRMALMLGEKVGQTVGYRMRMDTSVGPRTRIEVVTEGVLTRMLQSDPALEDTAIVIFDEFHERSLQADLGLALALQSRALLRDDLRLLVMSATLDGGPVARLLGDAPIITSEGRSYPVETRYTPRDQHERFERAVAATVIRALREESGDMLVFLPGAGEIRRVESLLNDSGLDRGVIIAPLHGTLPQEAQDTAIEPSKPGMRKVVLATSIAETSLTIEGIRIVIDGGLMRVPRFSPRSGMTRLETIRVTHASASQRCGRAGRLGPGLCYRLWSQQEQEQLLAFSQPEILEADLAPLALDLAEWGIATPRDLAWLDTPPEASFAQARELLSELGALDRDGTITPHGRSMSRLALHPRLAHMLLRGKELGLSAPACDLAALLGERDILRSETGPPDADLRLRLDALRGTERTSVHGYRVDSGALHRARMESRQLRKQLRVESESGDMEAAGLLLAFAYPDRIGQQRAGQPGRFVLRNGNAASIADHQSLATSPFIVAAELDGRRTESKIFLAAPLAPEEIEEHFADQIEHERLIAWDGEAQAVRGRERLRLGALVLRDVALHTPDPDAVTEALVRGIEQEGLAILPWSRASRQLQERLIFLHSFDGSWPDAADSVLLATLDDWLAPFIHGMKSRADLQRLDLNQALLSLLSWDGHRLLDDLAPTHLAVPSGSRIPIDYSNPESPVLAVRLQEMFGLAETPRIAGGRVALTIHLLSPAHRPVQVTRDLANFWRTTYFEVKKDLKGRYPKHYWPDDPMQATPTHRARPRG